MGMIEVPRVAGLVIAGAVLSAVSPSGERYTSADVPCSTTAEIQGIDSEILGRGLRGLSTETKSLHSLLIARNGCLVIEVYRAPYGRDTRHALNSITKAVLSALVGIAVHDGRLRENASALSNLPTDAGDDDTRRAAITIRDLLTMSSGIAWHQAPPENTSDEMGRSEDWIRFIRTRPMVAAPSTVTNYSNGDAHLLSAVLQSAVNETAFQFARRRLFAPLGIDAVAWDSDPQGRSIGSAALQMRPMDMLKFGVLYQRGGLFEGRRVLDDSWVAESLSPHASIPVKGGAVAYGYNWWLYPERHVAEAWGGAGQRIALIRDLNVVVVMTADDPTDYPRSPLAAQIYDAVRASVTFERLRPNRSAAAALERTAAELVRH